jgi:hypothetical protein
MLLLFATLQSTLLSSRPDFRPVCPSLRPAEIEARLQEIRNDPQSAAFTRTMMLDACERKQRRKLAASAKQVYLGDIYWVGFVIASY